MSDNKLFLYNMENTKNHKTVRYHVYDKSGRYHHSYMEHTDAVNCCKHINGRVVELKKGKSVPFKDRQLG